MLVDYLWVVLIGSVVGYSELATRYRDVPSAVIRILGAWIYILVNGSAAALALYVVRVFSWDFGAQAADSRSFLQVLLAGFGALIVLRSSFFSVRVGEQDISLGPALLLNSLLSIADRNVDRIRAIDRARLVAKIMTDISFEKCREALPAFCLTSMQNVSAGEQADLRTAIDALSGSELPDAARSYSLGLLLMNVSGPAVLEGAVEVLRKEIANAV
jgi:hypothetical protein